MLSHGYTEIIMNKLFGFIANSIGKNSSCTALKYVESDAEIKITTLLKKRRSSF